MRLGLYVSMLIGIAVLLAVDEPAAASIIDTGEVAVVDGVLEIGQTGAGLRVVDGEADGIYDGALLGIDPAASGQLRLQNAAAFSVAGALVVGRSGDGIVEVTGGSQLDSETAQIGVLPGCPPDCSSLSPTTAVRLDGAGSGWVNSGLLTIGDGRSPGVRELRLSDGASLSTVGVNVDVPFVWQGSTRSTITIEGPGTTWSNLGPLSMNGQVDFIVRDGAQAEDAGVTVRSDDSATRLIVDGPGSLWRTGEFVAGTGEVNYGGGIFVTSGGRLESESASLTTQTYMITHIDGSGSTWAIDGALTFGGNGQGGNSAFEVTNGGLLETGETSMTIPLGRGDVLLSGPGARWDNAGSLVYGGGETELGGRITIDAGATMSTGDTSVSCNSAGGSPSCEIAVLGAGSAFSDTGQLVLGGDAAGPLAPGILRIADQAAADVVGPVRAWAPGTITLDDATLTAPLVDLAGGLIEGRGRIDADLFNGGRVAPMAGIDPLSVSGDYEQTGAGTLSILLAGPADVSLLEVLGTSVLAGQLEVALADGFTPQVGDTFEVLRYAEHFGEFESYAGLDVGGGVTLVPEYGARSFVLRAVPEPGSGALVALGLVALAGRRRSVRRGARVPVTKIVR